MDAQGARDLTQRLGAKAGVAVRPVPADVPADALPLYRWVGGRPAVRTTEPAAPSGRPSLRRLRFRGR
jgi:hypothetical protein